MFLYSNVPSSCLEIATDSKTSSMSTNKTYYLDTDLATHGLNLPAINIQVISLKRCGNKYHVDTFYTVEQLGYDGGLYRHLSSLMGDC